MCSYYTIFRMHMATLALEQDSFLLLISAETQTSYKSILRNVVAINILRALLGFISLYTTVTTQAHQSRAMENKRLKYHLRSITSRAGGLVRQNTCLACHGRGNVGGRGFESHPVHCDIISWQYHLPFVFLSITTCLCYNTNRCFCLRNIRANSLVQNNLIVSEFSNQKPQKFTLAFISYYIVSFGLIVLIKGLFYILSQVADFLQISKLAYSLRTDTQ